ncbi:hypothetical protein JCM8547_000395 [Rhodosporidiobolus lusitaniae]
MPLLELILMPPFVFPRYTPPPLPRSFDAISTGPPASRIALSFASHYDDSRFVYHSSVVDRCGAAALTSLVGDVDVGCVTGMDCHAGVLDWEGLLTTMPDWPIGTRILWRAKDADGNVQQSDAKVVIEFDGDCLDILLPRHQPNTYSFDLEDIVTKEIYARGTVVLADVVESSPVVVNLEGRGPPTFEVWAHTGTCRNNLPGSHEAMPAWLARPRAFRTRGQHSLHRLSSLDRRPVPPIVFSTHRVVVRPLERVLTAYAVKYYAKTPEEARLLTASFARRGASSKKWHAMEHEEKASGSVVQTNDNFFLPSYDDEKSKSSEGNAKQ